MSTSSATAVGTLLGTLGSATDLQSELAAVLNREHQILTAVSVEDLMKLDALKEAAKGKDSKVREAAASALKKVDGGKAGSGTS